MELINHTIEWCKGEIFEGKMSLLFGFIVLVTGVAYWKWGSTPYAKAIVWPLLIVGLIAIGIGAYLVTTNQKRIPEYKTEYMENAKAFAQSEKQRTASFIQWYPITQKIIFGIVIIGMLCLMLTLKPVIRSIGIGLLILSLYGFVLDHFSEERARTYHTKIVENLP